MYGPDTGAVDSSGRLAANTSLPTAVGITWDLCVRACGSGAESFNLSVFSQSIVAWLLPWLALISQLPFGAKHRFDNLMALLLTMGSPTLAGYTLALTILNTHHVAHRFSGITYPNAQTAFRILSSLQQAPIEIDIRLLPSLVVLSENDEWWRELAERLNYVHTWNFSARASIAWVVVAYICTVLDSFSSLAEDTNNASLVASDGQAVGSLWLWLLAIVIGWLQVSPKCDDQSIKAALSKADSLPFVARIADSPKRASDINDERAISVAEEHAGDNEDGARDDERASAPIYNYSRFLPWTLNVEKVVMTFRNADFRARKHVRVDSCDPADWHKAERAGEIHPLNRTGTYEQLNAYCANPYYDKPPCCAYLNYAFQSHWGPHVVSRFLLASFAGLALQWGTISASLIILLYTPAKGLGCQSTSFILYASLSTVIWTTLILSSFLVHISTSLKKGSVHRFVVRQLANFLRRFGKILAVLNSIWVITSCVLQFSQMYDTCFCNMQFAEMLAHNWNHAYYIILMSDVADTLTAPWIGGILLGCGCVALYVLLVNLHLVEFCDI